MAPDQRNTSNDEAQFSRSTMGGKKNSWAKARVSDELKFDLARECHVLDISESEFIEKLLAIRLYGKEHVDSLQQQKLDRVAGVGPRGDAKGLAP
jgi:hypothetical protein